MKNINKLEVGENLSIHDYCYIDAIGGIQIGNNVSIAHNCSLISFNHTWEDDSQPIKYNPTSNAKIIIKDDVWLGCGVRVMPGVTLGERSIVVAGAIVASDVEPKTVEEPLKISAYS